MIGEIYMKSNTFRILKLTLLSFFVGSFLLSIQAAASQTPKVSMDFTQLIEEQNLTLTIYYLSPAVLANRPIKTRDIKKIDGVIVG
jgi:hypothetical protein